MFAVAGRTFVALDIETTGLDPKRDRVTEVGAVRFDEDGVEVDTFQSLVDPGRDIPRFVESLTGLTSADVRGAPALAEIGPRLLAFVGEGPLVGQNIGFDIAHLREGGVILNMRAIDTSMLSRMLLPEGPRGLGDLANQLDVEVPVAHRALPDARTTAAVFTALRARARQLPSAQRLQLARLASMHDPELAEFIAGDDWATAEPGERALVTVQPGPTFPQLVRREPRTPVPAADVARALAAGPNGLDGFEERPEQREMAEAVRQALSDGGHWLVEAGTGVGKSLAYLLPAALHALRNGERVVISTNTINLQEQLLAKDIPAVRRMLRAAGVIEDEDDLRATVLKGRGNYLCLRRWTANFGAHMADPDFGRLAASLLLWLPRTSTGDRSELRLDNTDRATWQRLSAQDTDCLARQNPFVRDGRCFLQRARKAAESAHLVIVNHALLLADIASGGSALPPFDHLIVDEAHNLEDQATKQFGGSVSRWRLAEALEGLHRRPGPTQREGGVAALLRSLPEGAASMAGAALEAAVARATAQLDPAFEALSAHVPRGGDEDKAPLDRSLRAQPAWAAAETACGTLDQALRDAIEHAQAAAQVLRETALVEETDALAGEIETACRKVEELRALMTSLMTTADPGTIAWLGRERDGTASLNCAPLEVGPVLWEKLFSGKRTVVATSATLSAAGSMEYTSRRLGLEAPRTLQLGSPFDYERSTLLAAFTDIPEPAEPTYSDAVALAVARLVRASEGRTLALFTSHNALRKAATALRTDLAEDGIAVLAQGVDGTPRQLIERLVEDPRTVLLGTSSFWEGVDVRGDALSMLIIARLPFAVPTDPVQRARSEEYDDPFREYSLPAAILRFRQGFGRLIRSRTDRGVVAVLDRRIYEKSYGREFLSALPPCTMVRADSATVALRAREWLE
jgi:DNA polymerase-3 subunit epsilon/ATP-dependent DNA helicase DinG